MSAWDGHLPSLLAPDPFTKKQEVLEAAIVGHEGGVWCGTGSLLNITVEEVKKVLALDRSSLFSHGATIGGVKCTVISDEFEDKTSYIMKLRTKSSEGDAHCISIYKSPTALVVVKSVKDGTASSVNTRAYTTGNYLRESGY